MCVRVSVVPGVMIRVRRDNACAHVCSSSANSPKWPVGGACEGWSLLEYRAAEHSVRGEGAEEVIITSTAEHAVLEVYSVCLRGACEHVAVAVWHNVAVSCTSRWAQDAVRISGDLPW